MQIRFKLFLGLLLLFFTNSSIAQTLRGDINNDGKVDEDDVSALVNAYLRNESPTSATDLDGDNSLTIADVTALISLIKIYDPVYNPNGHEYVDLGLPSGARWATCNVGASAPEEFGEYYAWGEIEGKQSYSWETYKWCDGTTPKVTNMSLTKYCDRGGYGTMDGKISLELEDDVAHVKWGGSWHIPTETEILELINNCESEWTTINDVSGMSFKGVNGNSIFIPAAGSKKNESFSSGEGEYWSTTLGNHSTTIPYFNFYKKTIELYEGELYNTQRYRGLTIRPVLSEYTPAVNKIDAPSSYRNHDLVDLGLPSGTLWATCNIGASSPEDFGCYYAWGETEGTCEGKTSYLDDTYKFFNGSAMSKYHEGGEVLEPIDDVATVKWGGEWRMPTYSEISELQNTKYTSCEWTTENGVNGYRITSIVKGFEGNSIFLPAAGAHRDKTGRLLDAGTKGYYWGSTLSTGDDAEQYASWMVINSSRISKGSAPRSEGLSIRPVVHINSINQ